MKKNLLLIFFLITTLSFSQTYKDRAIEFAYKNEDNYGNWTDWSEWNECNIIIVSNLEKMTFTIYSKETQEFDIVDFLPKKYDKDGFEIFEMVCIDKNGVKCHIRQRFLNKNSSPRSQLYVDYSNIIYVYNLE